MKQFICRLVNILAMSTVLILTGCVSGGGGYNDSPSYNYGVYGGYGYPRSGYGYGGCCYGNPGRPAYPVRPPPARPVQPIAPRGRK